MSELALAVELPLDWETAIQEMITEDDAPVDNRFTEKQMRLLAESLYASWLPEPFADEPGTERKFIAATNVGIFTSPYQAAIVPDMFLSLDVEGGGDFSQKENRSYCLWVFEKAPEIVVEIISDKRGDEFNAKMKRYGKMGVSYYITFDPFEIYDAPHIRVYERAIAYRYRLREDLLLPEIGLSLKRIAGKYENAEAEWLRWCDLAGNPILTGKERADTETRRADKLAEKLRQLGIDPNSI